MKRVYTASVTATGGRNGYISSTDKMIDMPLALVDGLGKSDSKSGTNPEQLFAGAYAACFETSIHAVANAHGITIQRSSVTAEVGINKGNDGFHLNAVLFVFLPEIDEQTKHMLIKKAHEVCPYSRAIGNNIEVDIQLLADDPKSANVNVNF
jgi:osmotically inducible protein OsmC